MDWIFKYSFPQDEINEVIRSTGALLIGRRSYDVGQSENAPSEAQKPFGGAWTGPQIILTHNPPNDTKDPIITFFTGDIREAVNKARKVARGKSVLIIGAFVARQCIDVGLIDEILVHIVPVLLGDGTPFFRRQGNTITELERIKFTQFGKIVNLRFRVLK